jgi:hypothetical protein
MAPTRQRGEVKESKMRRAILPASSRHFFPVRAPPDTGYRMRCLRCRFVELSNRRTSDRRFSVSTSLSISMTRLTERKSSQALAE